MVRCSGAMYSVQSAVCSVQCTVVQCDAVHSSDSVLWLCPRHLSRRRSVYGGVECVVCRVVHWSVVSGGVPVTADHYQHINRIRSATPTYKEYIYNYRILIPSAAPVPSTLPLKMEIWFCEIFQTKVDWDFLIPQNGTTYITSMHIPLLYL